MWFAPFYFVFVVPALLPAAWASGKVHQAYLKAWEVGTSSGYSGAETAKAIISRRSG